MYQQIRFYEDALNGWLLIGAVVAAIAGAWSWMLIALPAISILLARQAIESDLHPHRTWGISPFLEDMIGEEKELAQASPGTTDQADAATTA